jgi:hypothetical protein
MQPLPMHTFVMFVNCACCDLAVGGDGRSVRAENTKRKSARERAKDRKDLEREQKLEEIARLKKIKQAEIAEKLAEIKQITGTDFRDFGVKDLEADFDPEEHDRQAEAMFNEECVTLVTIPMHHVPHPSPPHPVPKRKPSVPRCHVSAVSKRTVMSRHVTSRCATQGCRCLGDDRARLFVFVVGSVVHLAWL